MKKFLSTIKGEVYGFVEGDIVSDALHLYPLYTSAVGIMEYSDDACYRES